MLSRTRRLLITLVYGDAAADQVRDYLLAGRTEPQRLAAISVVRSARACARAVRDEPGGERLVHRLTRLKAELHAARDGPPRHGLLLGGAMAVTSAGCGGSVPWAYPVGFEWLGPLAFAAMRLRLSADQAERKLRQWLEAEPDVARWTARRIAAELGVSAALIAKLPAWAELMEETSRGRSRSVSPRRQLQLHDDIRDEVLERLLAAQARDDEGSPLESDELVADRKRKARRRAGREQD